MNKAGNVINDSGKLVGRVVSGVLKALVNKTVDAEGNIYNDTGKGMQPTHSMSFRNSELTSSL